MISTLAVTDMDAPLTRIEIVQCVDRVRACMKIALCGLQEPRTWPACPKRHPQPQPIPVDAFRSEGFHAKVNLPRSEFINSTARASAAMAASGSSYAVQSTSPRQQHAHPGTLSQHGSDGADGRHENWSGDESGDGDDDGDGDTKKRKRPMSVSCELCKQRKVKCDRGQPRCGWCLRNNQVCEYKERKKPGLRAGYGRELEARLGEAYPINLIAWRGITLMLT